MDLQQGGLLTGDHKWKVPAKKPKAKKAAET